MSISPQQAARHMVAREQLKVDALERARKTVTGRLELVAEVLRESFGARRVRHFGSLAWGGFHEGSDVDLAVAGVAAQELGHAMAEASRVAGRTVELFCLDELNEDFRLRVVREGRELQ